MTPSAARTTYVWDIDNRMTKALLPAGLRNTSMYNGEGQRVQREDSSGTAKFIWDEENILVETDSGGTTQAQSTLEPAFYGNLLSQRRSGASSWHLFDALGSTRSTFAHVMDVVLEPPQQAPRVTLLSGTVAEIDGRPFDGAHGLALYQDRPETAAK